MLPNIAIQIKSLPSLKSCLVIIFNPQKKKKIRSSKNIKFSDLLLFQKEKVLCNLFHCQYTTLQFPTLQSLRLSMIRGYQNPRLTQSK